MEPVMAVVLPKGKSLDECAELTQRRTHSRAAQDGAHTSQPKRRRKPKVSTGGRRTVFDFLNHKLGDKSSDPAAAGAAGATGVEAYRAGKSTKRSLNVKLFQAAERVAQTEREIQKLSESLGRQTGRSVLNIESLTASVKSGNNNNPALFKLLSLYSVTVALKRVYASEFDRKILRNL